MDSNHRSDSDREWTERRIHRRRPDIRHSRRIPQSLDRNEHLHPLGISGSKDHIDSVIDMNTTMSNSFCYTEDCSGNRDDFGMTRDIHHLRRKAWGCWREDHRATYGIVSDQDRNEILIGNGIFVCHLAYRNTAYTVDSQYLSNTRRPGRPLRWNLLPFLLPTIKPLTYHIDRIFDHTWLGIGSETKSTLIVVSHTPKDVDNRWYGCMFRRTSQLSMKVCAVPLRYNEQNTQHYLPQPFQSLWSNGR